MTFADRAIGFYSSLRVPDVLPRGVAAMNPYRDPMARGLTAAFLQKFFADDCPRVLVFGINPGRFGGGATGVSFTDPVALQDFCGIANGLPQVCETSSRFVWDVVAAYGGPRAFFWDFYLTAVSPLGFVKGGLNYNFYDDPALLRDIRPWLAETMAAQVALGARRDVAVVLGTGKLRAVFESLNGEHGFFDRVIYLEHPRFIMQYKRKRLAEYVEKYLRALEEAAERL